MSDQGIKFLSNWRMSKEIAETFRANSSEETQENGNNREVKTPALAHSI